MTLNTFSPLDVNFGISAGKNIFLSTEGDPPVGTPPNDMFLDGAFNYGGDKFEVTIGAFGTLTKGALFSGHHYAEPPRRRSIRDSGCAFAVRETTYGADQAINFGIKSYGDRRGQGKEGRSRGGQRHATNGHTRASCGGAARAARRIQPGDGAAPLGHARFSALTVPSGCSRSDPRLDRATLSPPSATATRRCASPTAARSRCGPTPR